MTATEPNPLQLTVEEIRQLPDPELRRRIHGEPDDLVEVTRRIERERRPMIGEFI